MSEIFCNIWQGGNLASLQLSLFLFVTDFKTNACDMTSRGASLAAQMVKTACNAGDPGSIPEALVTWCEELTHLKRPWCWERLKSGGEGDDRGWDGWIASPTQWTRVWVNSESWWWTGRPDVLLSTGSQRVGHDWASEQQPWVLPSAF